MGRKSDILFTGGGDSVRILKSFLLAIYLPLKAAWLWLWIKVSGMKREPAYQCPECGEIATNIKWKMMDREWAVHDDKPCVYPDEYYQFIVYDIFGKLKYKCMKCNCECDKVQIESNRFGYRRIYKA